jgi:hypothetical protein
VTRGQARLAGVALAAAVGLAVWWVGPGFGDRRRAATPSATPGLHDDNASQPVTTPHTPPPKRQSASDARSSAQPPTEALASPTRGDRASASDGEPTPDAAQDESKPEKLAAALGAVAAKPNPEPVGTLDKEEIQAAIRSVTPAIKGCYEEGLKRTPDLAGRVVVQFVIAGGDDDVGFVRSGEVSESEADSVFFEACVLQKVSDVEFPAPGGGGVVTVRYPFNFDPGGGFGGDPPAQDTP